MVQYIELKEKSLHYLQQFNSSSPSDAYLGITSGAGYQGMCGIELAFPEYSVHSTESGNVLCFNVLIQTRYRR